MTDVLTLEDSHTELEHDPVVVDTHEDRIVQQAIALLERRMFKAGTALRNPSEVCDYLRLMLVGEPNEIFAVLLLDTRHKVLAYEPLFSVRWQPMPPPSSSRTSIPRGTRSPVQPIARSPAGSRTLWI